MNKIGIIITREFNERVRKKSFIITTILMPLLMIGLMVAPSLMMLFAKDFPNMAAKRYEENDSFFVKMFTEQEMMDEIINTVGAVLYARLKAKKKVYYMETEDTSLMAAENKEVFSKN